MKGVQRRSESGQRKGEGGGETVSHCCVIKGCFSSHVVVGGIWGG